MLYQEKSGNPDLDLNLFLLLNALFVLPFQLSCSSGGKTVLSVI
jgi:hypothetical protein